ncbi:hypothetical protein Y032_0017g3254 [Ancylostoma ceylanicum]|uniref:Uncharacterized protein n=1 Tax=Ancylostoma ceylanicum TaxID=53326 RepID=A0A016V3L4_9BILA|nr:hypothetical protein Y032_0017g3254 [Ancylostoma ceylanicum]
MSGVDNLFDPKFRGIIREITFERILSCGVGPNECTWILGNFHQLLWRYHYVGQNHPHTIRWPLYSSRSIAPCIAVAGDGCRRCWPRRPAHNRCTSASQSPAMVTQGATLLEDYSRSVRGAGSCDNYPSSSPGWNPVRTHSP